MDHPPAPQDSWTVVGAKNEAASPPAFRDGGLQEGALLHRLIRSPTRNGYRGADHISIRLFDALGYHVPENCRGVLRGDPATRQGCHLADRLGRRRRMTDSDLTTMLLKVPKTAEGRYRATASRAIPGKQALAPTGTTARASDDPADFIPHEHRRDLRGQAVVAAWLDHAIDSRAINTYDSVVEENRPPLHQALHP